MTGKPPSDPGLLALARDQVVEVNRRLAVVLVLTFLGGLLLGSWLFVSEADDLDISTVVTATGTSGAVAGIFFWVIAWRPRIRIERQLRAAAGEDVRVTSTVAEEWVLGAFIGWILAAILGAMARLIVEIPTWFGWPVWAAMTLFCRSALRSRRDEGT